MFTVHVHTLVYQYNLMIYTSGIKETTCTSFSIFRCLCAGCMMPLRSLSTVRYGRRSWPTKRWWWPKKTWAWSEPWAAPTSHSEDSYLRPSTSGMYIIFKIVICFIRGNLNYFNQFCLFCFGFNVYFCRGSYKKNTVFIQLQHEFYIKPGSYNKTGWRNILHQILQS